MTRHRVLCFLVLCGCLPLAPAFLTCEGIAEYGTGCPDGIRAPEYNCLIDPCESLFDECSEKGMTCKRNYCGGCNAICCPHEPVECDPRNTMCERVCPDTCAENPCKPWETCTVATCDDCRPMCCTRGPFRKRKCELAQIFDDECPPGLPKVECFADPCLTKECPNGKSCIANYCGGCHAICCDDPEPPHCPTDDVWECEDGTVLHRDPELACEFPECPAE
mmetsp:Transcript_37370/g.76675  ORF Transcript_37370/g.76675 Transcript_37370/m.76675 type:complete len:221 (-) Transcript_37370:372-1034(-)